MIENEINRSIYDPIEREEYAVSTRDIESIGPIAACGKYHLRLDEGASKALSSSVDTLACSNGCAYCCHLKVELRAEEAFRIVNYVRVHFSQEKMVSLRSEIVKNSKVMMALTYQEQLSVNMKCPFLENNSCTIYEVRPDRCRSYHAQAVENCIKAYEEPTNLDIPNTYSTSIFSSNKAHSDGYRQALSESGYDAAVYELNSALNIAMVDAKYRKRFEKKKRAFKQSIVASPG